MLALLQLQRRIPALERFLRKAGSRTDGFGGRSQGENFEGRSLLLVDGLNLTSEALDHVQNPGLNIVRRHFALGDGGEGVHYHFLHDRWIVIAPVPWDEARTYTK